MELFAKIVNCFCKILHLRYLNGFWIRLRYILKTRKTSFFCSFIWKSGFKHIDLLKRHLNEPHYKIKYSPLGIHSYWNSRYFETSRHGSPYNPASALIKHVCLPWQLNLTTLVASAWQLVVLTPPKLHVE